MGAERGPDDPVVEERRRRAIELRVSGKKYREIATELRIGLGQAYRDVKAVIDRTKAEADENADEIRRIELERIDEAIAAMMPNVRAGDPRCCEVLVKLQDRRSRYLGLDAPAKHEHSGPDGAPIPIDARSALTERLAGLIAGAAGTAATSEDPSEPERA